MICLVDSDQGCELKTWRGRGIHCSESDAEERDDESSLNTPKSYKTQKVEGQGCPNKLPQNLKLLKQKQDMRRLAKQERKVLVVQSVAKSVVTGKF